MNQISQDVTSRTSQPAPLLGPRARDNKRRRALDHVHAASVLPSEHTIRYLFVARESSEYDYGLLVTMIEQVVCPFAYIPAVQQVLAESDWLLRPGPGGDLARSRVRARPMYAQGSTRLQAVLVVLDDAAFLLGLVSAGSTTEKATNEWVTTVADTVRQLRPQILVTGPFSRLVRNQDVAGPLAGALRVTATEVKCAEWSEGFVLGNRGGDQVWSMLVNFAHQEWLATNVRLLTGTLFDLKNNRLPRSASVLPLGYIKVPSLVSKKLTPAVDESLVPLVRELIGWAASNMPLMEIAERLGQAGVRTRAGKLRADGQLPLIHESVRPEESVSRLLGHLPTYLHGDYIYHHGNPIPGLKELHGLPVYRDNADEKGEFRVTVKLGVPQGGWHEPEVIQAAIERRLTSDGRTSPTTRSSDRMPLSGALRFVDRGFLYRLTTHDEHYDLRSRPWTDDDEADPEAATIGQREGDVQAHLRTRELHAAVAAALREVCSTQPTDIRCLDHLEERPDEEEMGRRADEGESKAAALWEMAAGTTDPAEREALKRQASAAFQTASELRQQVHAARDYLLLRQARHLPASVDQVLSLAELLERHPAQAPVEVNLAVRKIMRELRIAGEPGTPWAEFQFSVDIQTSRGPIRLGPIKGQCRNWALARRARSTDPVPARRELNIVQRLLSANMEQLAQADGHPNPYAAHDYAKESLTELIPHPIARARLVDCPIQAARASILAGVVPDLVELPVNLDERYVQEMQAVYLDPAFPAQSAAWASKDATKSRQVLGWVARYSEGENGVRLDELRRELDLSAPDSGKLLTSEGYSGKLYGRRSLLEKVIYWKPRTQLDPELKRVRIPACPHCGHRSLLAVLVVPELPDGVLCTNCLRAPSTPFAFPPEYLLPWVGPYGHGHRGFAPRKGVKIGTHLAPFHIPPRLR